MFVILVAVILSTGQVGMLQSNKTYETKAACEADIPKSVDEIKTFLASKGLAVADLKAVCDVPGQDASK